MYCIVLQVAVLQGPPIMGGPHTFNVQGLKLEFADADMKWCDLSQKKPNGGNIPPSLFFFKRRAHRNDPINS